MSFSLCAHNAVDGNNTADNNTKVFNIFISVWFYNFQYLGMQRYAILCK